MHKNHCIDNCQSIDDSGNSQSLDRDGAIMLPWWNARNSHQPELMKVTQALMDMLVLLWYLFVF